MKFYVQDLIKQLENNMYGVIITSRPTCQVAETIDHVDGLPSYNAAKRLADEWRKSAPNNREAFIYEMEK